MTGQAWQQASLDQGRLAAARRAIKQTDPERLGGRERLDPGLPETQGIRQALLIALPGQQRQEEVRIVTVEGTESSGDDHERTPQGAVGRDQGLGGVGLGVRRGIGDRQGKVAQVVGQGLGGGVAIDHPLGQRLEADPLEFRGGRRVPLTQRRRVAGLDPGERLGRRRPRERPPTGAKFVEHAAEAEDVGASVDAVPFASGLFGAHVVGRADVPGGTEVLVLEGQAEVGEERLVGGVKQDVGGLDVAMDQLVVVGMVRRLGHVSHEPRCFPEREGGRLHPLPEIAALNVFGDDVAKATRGVAQVVDRHDVRVVELGEDAPLGKIDLDVRGAGDLFRERHLDGHFAVKFLVLGQVHTTEPALAQQPDHLVAADGGGLITGRWPGRDRDGG